MRCNSILEAIGNTPLVRLNRIVPAQGPEIWVKLEAHNPGGSAKDRLALHLVKQAEASGILSPGHMLVEASAGNTGIGLALVAAVRGYRAVIVVPNGTSPQKLAVAKAYGAEIRTCAADEDYDEVASKLADQPGWFRPDQFGSSENPRAHGGSTADELWREMDGRIDAVVATSGTGGTLAGLGRALKARDARISLVRAWPERETGAESELEGVANEGPPDSFECPVVDAVVRVRDDEAVAMVARLAREEGILVGGSSGAAVVAALRYAENHGPVRIVAILPDTGRNYLSS